MKSLAQEQFVTDAKGKAVAVVINVKTYERLLEAEEELADIRAFDAAWPEAQTDLKTGKTVSAKDYMARRIAKAK